MSFLAAIPSIAQGISSLISSFGNKGDKLKKISNFDPNQKQFFNQYTQNALGNQSGMNDVMGLLQSMLDPNSDFFQNFEDQQMNQFNEQTLPNIAERFAGGGALSSSGFGQALGGAASGLQSNLAAGKSGMIMQALQQLLNQYNQQANTVLGAKPFDYLNKQGGSGFAGNFAQGLGNTSQGGWGDLIGSLQSAYQGYQGNNLMNQSQGIKG